MARPKKSVPMAEVGWRIPAHLVEWGRAQAAQRGIDPGAWLTRLFERAQEGEAARDAAALGTNATTPGSSGTTTAVTGRAPVQPRPKARDAR